MKVVNNTDKNGNPSGGYISGRGIEIDWQNGPLVRDGRRRQPNGAFVEDVIKAAISRLLFYQTSKFECEYNQKALEHLEAALTELHKRTVDREVRGVEGKNIV